jgi:hypothetical protein
MLLAALVVLAGIVIVASGRGGEMAYEHPDYPPLDLGPVTAADVALLRPPSAAWGYNMRVTDEALAQIARAMSERDVRISALEQRVTDLREELSRGLPPRPGARHRAPGGVEPGLEAPGGVEPGLEAPGGPEPGLEAPGGVEPGLEAPGGPEPRLEAPGGVEPGLEAPGGPEPGLEAAGGVEPGLEAPGGEEAGLEFTAELPRPVWPPVTDIVPAASPSPERGPAGDQRSATNREPADLGPEERHPEDQQADEHGGPAQWALVRRRAPQRTQDKSPAGPPAPDQDAPDKGPAPGQQPASGPPWAVRSSSQPGPGGNGGPRPAEEDETGG